MTKRFEMKEGKEEDEEIEGLMGKVVSCEGSERKLVEDEEDVSQLDTTGELNEIISQM